MIFVDGLPKRITVEDFKSQHLQSFPLFVEGHDDIIEQSIHAVYTLFPGAQELWDRNPKEVWYDKTLLFFALATAWRIADIYPELCPGIGSAIVDGIPIKKKKIGGVEITFAEVNVSGFTGTQIEDNYAGLRTNRFGKEAYMMIRTSGKRVLAKNSRRRA
jgi:hypothetical protein